MVTGDVATVAAEAQGHAAGLPKTAEIAEETAEEAAAQAQRKITKRTEPKVPHPRATELNHAAAHAHLLVMIREGWDAIDIRTQ